MREIHTLNSKSAAVKKGLDYPVIDADAHVLECEWAIMDYIRDIGGPKLAERFEKSGGRPGYNKKHRSMFWAAPSGKYTIDRATCMLPRLYADRLEDAGIDFAIVYTTYGISANQVRDPEMRQVLARSLNSLYAEMFDDVKDRMTPSAVIPTWTPEEAIEELEFAAGLGLKTITIAGEVRDAVPEVAAVDPALGELTQRITSICMEPRDGNDYDPFWQRCVDLKMMPAGHAGSQKSQRRQSPNVYSFNRLGTFSVGNEFFARSLFFSGVLQRFPTLNFAFLEGGVAWACQLYNDLMEIYEKRNLDWIYEHQDPSKLDVKLMEEMFDRFGHLDYMTKEKWGACQELPQSQKIEDRPMNDFEASGVESREDIRDQFVPNFYYGADADDKMTALAFDEKINHFGVNLKAVFSSDIGHWDVPDMSGVLQEAWEMVEKGTINEDNFKDFVFTNTAEMHAQMDPDFYKGTVVEDAVAKVMATHQRPAASAAE